LKHSRARIAATAVLNNLLPSPPLKGLMLRPLVRSTLSVLVTTCFALSAITWGSMPGCMSTESGVPAAHVAHGQGASHHHAKTPGNLPGAIHCFVHLCCIQLTAPATATIGPAGLASSDRSLGPISAVAFVLVRPSHTLPFAHAPPSIAA
jgi:hypothetical protein